jgi:hypothetical protein
MLLSCVFVFHAHLTCVQFFFLCCYCCFWLCKSKMSDNNFCHVFSASFSGFLICLSHDVFDLVVLGFFLFM